MSERMPTPSDAPTLPGPAKRILIVEDEPTVRGLLADMLESNGYQCLVAANAADAMRILKSGAVQFDLLLSDVMLPGPMTGIDLCIETRQLFPDIRLLLITGYADEKVQDQISTVRIRMLPKPFLQSDLIGAIEEELARTPDPNVTTIGAPRERSC
jgi:two-component system, cell cycle response regulator CpdR